ncbi:MAG: proline hydroxylase [Reyranella sp.]|uniref:2OG-Fe(II) oxygenase n=1 Tax=Reyranella sp. TaxID=1929291 RepID=UPI00122731A5|nr:2OG-Fe(II) oxygenase [Reyranella sp.]TAJ35712.1 MAG: proline hydroxylase [Reyranella sp.]
MIDTDSLATRGFAVIPSLIDPAQCRGLAALWPNGANFRSRVVMQRHGYGRGEYQYFTYPLPEPVERLRQALYPPLAEVANRWNGQLGRDKRFPPNLRDWLGECHAGGQKRPTPLLLRYGPGDYNCLHRDLYGDLVFPLQATILLSDPTRDFDGGEFMLVEQRPRMQSRGEVVRLGQGDAVIFAVNERPVKGTRGFYRTAMRHGVSTVRRGQRFTLGIIFHDAA